MESQDTGIVDFLIKYPRISGVTKNLNWEGPHHSSPPLPLFVFPLPFPFTLFSFLQSFPLPLPFFPLDVGSPKV